MRAKDTMANTKFRVALSGDFRKADGSPTYPDFDLEPLRNASGVEMAFLEASNPLRADQLEDFDALILLAHRFDATSVPKSGRLAVVARFGVGYDTVDVKACTDAGIALVITPDGVRRPVAVSIITLMLALTGKLTDQGRADAKGARRVQQALGAYGCGPGRPDARIAGHRQHRRRDVSHGQAVRHEVHRPRPVRGQTRSPPNSASNWSGSRICSAAPTCCR